MGIFIRRRSVRQPVREQPANGSLAKEVNVTLVRSIGRSEAACIRDSLVANFEAGTLTEEELLAAILAIDEGGSGCIPESVGVSWLWRNPEALGKVPADPVRFMKDCWGKSYEFRHLALRNTTCLQLVPEAEREAFVRELACEGFSDFDESFVQACRESGLSRQTVSDIISGALERAPKLPQEHNVYSLFHSFLGGGGGHRSDMIGQHAPWAQFDEGSFMAAIKICVNKAPHLVLRFRDELQRKLGVEQAKEVCILALDQVSSVEGFGYKVISDLPLENRCAFAKRMVFSDFGYAQNTTVELFVDLMLALGETFYNEVADKIEKMSASELYKRSREAMRREHASNNPHVPWFDGKIRERMTKDGYVFGVVAQGSHINRRTGRKFVQFQVTHKREICVQDSYQRDVYLTEGMNVYFMPSRGTMLTPRVRAVYFFPA